MKTGYGKMRDNWAEMGVRKINKVFERKYGRITKHKDGNRKKG